MTQEQAAGLLGVRREGVTAAALRLQRAGLIRYQRGRVRVLDRDGPGKSRLRVLCRGDERALAAVAKAARGRTRRAA